MANIDAARAADFIVALRERCTTLVELVEKAKTWLQPISGYDEAAIAKQINPMSIAALQALRTRFAAQEEWQPAALHDAIQAVLAELNIGMGKVGPALRLAITGTTTSPSLDQTVYLCGKAEALTRIDALLARCA